MSYYREMLFAGVLQTFVVIIQTLPLQKKEKRLRTWGLFLLFFMASSYFRFFLFEGENSGGAWFLCLFYSSFALIVKWILDTSWRGGLETVVFNIVISMTADLMVAGMMALQGESMVPVLGEIDGIVYLYGVLMSYSVQMIFSILYAIWKRKRIQKVKEEANEDANADDTVLFPVILLTAQLIISIWGFIISERYAGQTFTPPLLSAWLVILLVMALITLWQLLYSSRQDELRSMEQKLAILEKKNEAVYQYYRVLEQEYHNLHRFRHDFNNLLTAAGSLAEQGDVERAGEMFRKMEKMLDGMLEADE